jgi:hypothetical protein
MSSINNWLEEITGFEIDENVEYEYEEYIDETNGEKMKSKKELTGKNISIKSSLSKVIKYIDKKYPEFYSKIEGNMSMLGISISNNHITWTGLLCTYLFLQWKKYTIETLGEAKYLKNVTFNSEFAKNITQNIQDWYFYINCSRKTRGLIYRKTFWCS